MSKMDKIYKEMDNNPITKQIDKIYGQEFEKISIKNKIARSLVIFIGEILGFMLIANLNVGLTVSSWEVGIITVIILAILNTVLWPFLTRVFMPFLVCTFGIGALILNGAVIYIISMITTGISIGGPGLILAPLGMAAVTTILSGVLTIDDNSSYYRAVTRDAEKRKTNKTVKNYPGMIIVEIDGLAEEILEEAIAKGKMPTLQSWIESGTHTLTGWETDLSSQTGASQAGILHGNNDNITAFRWIEKENNNKMMECTGFSDVPKIEERISNGDGLLVSYGASRSNLFSGDTDNVIFTYSKILNLQRLYNKAWYSVFSNPNNFARIIFLFFWEMILEIWSQISHALKNIRPRINRGLTYIPTRAGSNVFMREINTQTLIGDMYIGEIDVAYSTYLGYDEIAHHSGIRDNDAFYALEKLDKQFKRLEEASHYAKRPYYMVIQSDHGQGNGATFKQRQGVTFEKYVRSLLPEDMTMFSKMDSNDDHFGKVFIPFNKQVEFIKDKYNNSLEYVSGYEAKQHTSKNPEDSEVIVLASGNLAMIYLTQWKERLSYEQIVGLFPDLIPGLVSNQYVGFVLVKSEEHGAMAIGAKGIYYLEEDKIEGENPLEVFGENAAEHLRRSSSFEYTPDILVNSFYDPETEEICAFEELVGSHGGIGGTQSKPFILHPSDWEVEEPLVGAENIYKLLKKELDRLKNQKID